MADPDGLLRTFMMALCLWREARGESPLGKALVAQVIVNRTKDQQKRWPRTIVGVILQPYQFSSFNPNDPNARLWPKEGEASWLECVSVVDRVLTAEKPFTTANHYHVVGLKPAWRDDSKIVATEQHHVFYCL